MFAESHGSIVSRRFILIAHEIANATSADDITQRSWGSALLAGTYRAMCNACTLTAPGSALLGCPLFLQLWSWERFPISRPSLLGGFLYGIPEIPGMDPIDMPTCGTVWMRREVRNVFDSYIFVCHSYMIGLTYALFFTQRQYAHDQLRNCYTSFTAQFDLLDERSVNWQPYTASSI